MFIHQYLLVMTKHLLALYGLLLFAALRLDAQSREKTIMFFGNSLTAGYGLEPSQSFPSLIQEMLYEAGANYRVINAGLSGETSAGGLNRIDWVLNQEVDIFVLELGANDGLRGLPLESTKQNLQGIIAKLFEKYPSAKLVLAGMMVSSQHGGRIRQGFCADISCIGRGQQLRAHTFSASRCGGRSGSQPARRHSSQCGGAKDCCRKCLEGVDTAIVK
jgi:acyl-CoA thioesterase-1